MIPCQGAASTPRKLPKLRKKKLGGEKTTSKGGANPEKRFDFLMEQDVAPERSSLGKKRKIPVAAMPKTILLLDRDGQVPDEGKGAKKWEL